MVIGKEVVIEMNDLNQPVIKASRIVGPMRSFGGGSTRYEVKTSEGWMVIEINPANEIEELKKRVAALEAAQQ